MLRAKADAEDLVQEAYLRAVPKIEQFHGTSVGQLFVWLQRIQQHLVFDFSVRYLTDKRRIHQEVELVSGRSAEPADLETPSWRYRLQETLDAVSCARATLSEEHRRVADLRLEGMTFQEIAGRTSIAKTRVHRLWNHVGYCLDVILERGQESALTAAEQAAPNAG